MDKKLLETQALKLIEDSLRRDDSSVINLVKFARKNDLFFPELYQLWYTSKINQNIINAKAFPTEGAHHDFGIDTPQAASILADAFQVSIIELRQATGGGGVTRYFEKILKSGLFFDEDFWENNYMAKNLTEDRKPELKELNSANYAAWLDGQLADKPKVKQRKI